MRLTVEPDVIALSPGDTADLLVRVANDGEEDCTPFLAARGIDPDDVLLPSEVVAVGPGEVMTTIVRVRASADATPGDQRIAVAAEDLQGGQRPVSASTLLRVGARPDVAVQVEPVATTGRNRAKATTILRNRSDRRLQIDLEASGDGVAVRFRPGRIALDPGETRRVRTRIRRTRRSWFAEIRHGAVVTARGIGAPASTTLTFTQRPAIPRVAVRGLAAFMALTVWVAASVVVFQRLNAEDPAPTDAATAVGPAAPGPGRTSATGLFEEPEPEGVSLPVVIQGTVEGPRDPSGTLVTAERISFGDEGTTTGLTKVAALTPVKLPRGAVLDRVEVTTDERGRFRIASGLQSESFYRVTATRAGFEVGSFIVSTTDESPEVTLAIALDPAPGILAGRVVDAAGVAIGGASVLVTDGTLTYSTTTASEGLAAGTWTIEGVATPSTYEVVVTRLGYASQTLIVDVEGGQALRSIDATLIADRGTLRGTVRAVDPVTGQTAGVGGIDIALAGEEARTTRTITAPANLRGGFTFPALPYGVYELTFSAPGWETRVAEVTVGAGDVVLNVSDLVRSTGVVQGHVWQVVRGVDTDVTNITECRYPRLSQREDAETLARPCGGVSVSVTDDDGNVFASASATSTGFFQVDGVPAGEYSVRLSRAGYIDHVERIVLAPGGLRDLTPDHTTRAPDPITLGLRPALSACLGTVELIVVQRVLQSGSLTPVVVGTVNDPQSAVVPPAPAVAPAGIRVPASFDFECDTGQSPPQWFRVADNIYRLTNVPLGQTPIEVAFEGLQAVTTILSVTADGVASATVQVAPEPRDIGGTVRVLSNGAGAERNDVRVRVLDVNGVPVTGKEVTVDATTSVDLGSGVLASEATFTIPRVDVDADYRLTVDGPGITTVTSSLFTLTAGGTPFDPGRQDVRARTTVSGTVRGFTTSGSTVVPADLSGATITFTPDGGSALAPLTSAAGGTFALELDAGPYDVTVAAPGYATRTFSSVDLIGTAASPSQLLQPTTAPYAAYPTIVGTAGEVGLTPSARTVRVDVALDGASTASRAARVELVGGTIGGVATTTPSHSDTGTIDVDDATDSGRFTFASVPVGAYTLNVVPTDGAAEGVAHTAVTVVVGHDASASQLDTSTTAQAMSRITGRVVGFDVFTMALEPLSGATVAAPAAPYAATTGADGSFSLLVPSGTYGTAGTPDFAAITVAPTGSAYATRTVTGTVSDLAGVLPGVASPGGLFLVYPGLSGGSSGDVGLSPAARDVEVAVDLEGVDASTQRDLVVRLVDGEVTLGATSESLTDVALAAASSSVVTAGTAETFSSNAVRPGTYELDIAVASGTRVVVDELESDDPTTARVRQGSGADVGKWFVDIQPGTSTIGLSATVQARTSITGTVHGFDANLAPTPLVGATLTLPAAARATTTPGALPAESPVTVTTDANGEFTVEVDAGDYSAGTITLIADGYAQRAFEPVLAAATGTLLTGAASPDDRAFVPNAGLAGVSAAAGDVVLEPLARDVRVRVGLDGAPGVSRTIDVRLARGDLGGFGLPDVTQPVTVTVGTPIEVLFAAVPVGRYDLVADRTLGVTSATVNEIVVVPDATTPTGELDLRPAGSTENLLAQATVTVVGSVQEDTTIGDGTLASRSLAGVGVTAAATLVPVEGTPSVMSAGDGSFTLTLRSGTSGDLTLALTGFTGATIALSDLEDSGGTTSPLAAVTLEPSGIRIEGSVTENVHTVRAVRTDGTGTPVTGSLGVASGGWKDYELPPLDTSVGWTIEYEGAGVLLRRFVNAPSVRTIILNQDVRSGSFATITVDLSNPSGVPVDVRATLTERGPFPTIDATGALAQTVTVAANGSGQLVFADIPIRGLSGGSPADDSMLADRLTDLGGGGGLTFEILTVTDGWEPLARADIPDTLLDDVAVTVSRALVPRAERVVLGGPATLDAGEVGTFTLGIEDSSGAAAVVVEDTTFTLVTDTEAGTATFNPSSPVTIPAGQNGMTFTYANTRADGSVHRITATRSTGATFQAGNDGATIPVTVVVAPASRLTFATQPSATVAGQVIAPSPTVRIEDAFGNLTASTGPVAITPSGFTLSGDSTTTVNAVAGVATFSALTPLTGASGATLVASSGALTSGTSSSFNVSVPAPTDVTATSGTESIIVTWTAPSGVSVAGAAVEVRSGGSVVTQRPLGGDALSCTESSASPKDLTVPGAGTTCTIAGLTDGTISYTASVTVTSGGVSSAASDPSSPAVTPTVTTTTASVPTGCTSSGTRISCTATGSRIINFTRIKNNASIDYLIVGGGGGGGNDGGGGGGGGGVLTSTYTLPSGGAVTSLTAEVGVGGDAGLHARGGGPTAGGASRLLRTGGLVIDSVTGGAPGVPGASGAGGAAGAPGGGAGGQGGCCSGSSGSTSAITGVVTTYGGGGGGGSGTTSRYFGGSAVGGSGGYVPSSVTVATAGLTNRGGGGGGGATMGGVPDLQKDGGAGGSGIVIIELDP